MNLIRIFSEQPWVARFGWTLLHFLWQGLAIAALYAAAHGAIKTSPQRRYLLGCAALLAMLAAPLATYTSIHSPAPLSIAAPVSNSDSGTTFGATPGEHAPILSRGLGAGAIAASVVASVGDLRPQRLLPLIVMLWLTGALLFSLRLAAGCVSASCMRTRLARPAPDEWQRSIDRLKTRLQVARPVRLLVSALLETPVVIGWLRPVILIPISALAGLPAEHLEALLLHELAHIRRHDYLVNLLQSLAEALLFFHPAVWWISRHIRLERELCCDDLAVAATGDAYSYAIALADLESTRPAHVRALAANGGALADRIARLLGAARPHMPAFSAPASIAVLLAIAACTLFAQTADRPKFEVASVKPVGNQVRYNAGLQTRPGGRLHAENMSARALLMAAYHLQAFQIVGGPEWIRDAGFDLEAKGDPGATRDQMMVMLQSVLEERFQLKYHRETRELPVYALTVAKSGSKLPPPKEGNCVKADGPAPVPGPGEPPPIPCGKMFTGLSAGGMLIRGGDIAIADFIQDLSFMVGKPVLDRTAITKHFDLRMEFAADESVPGYSSNFSNVAGHSEMMAAAASASSGTAAAPNILLALQEQLGLKLESAKGPAEVMVLDHIEKPSAN